MNKKQSNKVNMFNAVLFVLNSFKSVWLANAIVSAAVNNIIAYISTLNLADQVKLAGTKGTTQNKELARSSLITLTLNHLAAGKAYAVVNNLVLLKEACSITRSELNHTKEADLESMCQNIYDAIQPYIADLTAYGATTASFATFNTAINNYHSLLGSTQSQRSAANVASLDINTQVSNITGLLDDTLDSLMIQFSTTNVSFYEQYSKARRIQNIGVRHLVLITGIISDVTKQALEGAYVYVVNMDNHKKITLANGKYKFVRLATGTYTVEVILSGYITQSKTLTVDTPQTVTVDFTMLQ
jgi:hypothetical protein